MNWYLIVAVVSAFLLGWALGLLRGTANGYAAAVQEQEERATQEMWSNFINQFKEGKNGK